MIVNKDVPCEMKLSHYLRYYQRLHGTRLAPGEADKEAAKEGFVLDHNGGTRKSGGAGRTESRREESTRM